jgi:hypothetical protein
MLQPPALSLIVPTRERTGQLRRLLDSLAATASRPEALEVVLVVDADDQASLDFLAGFKGEGRAGGVSPLLGANEASPRQTGGLRPPLALSRVVVPPGQSMGALNMAGYEASSGEHLMLLNDDVVARTPGWDEKILARCRRYPDGVFLVHINDTLLRENLCTFPVISRAWCELAGGLCPREYVRYRIDDHIEDVFNLLAFLGERRTIYLPDVVFEHFNFVESEHAPREYHSDPGILALDAPRFLEMLPARKELALALLGRIGKRSPRELAEARGRLGRIEDPFSLRIRGRQRVETDVPLGARLVRFARQQGALAAATWRRGAECFRVKGAVGLVRAGERRIQRLFRRRA